MNPRYWKWINSDFWYGGELGEFLIGVLSALLGIAVFVVGGPLADSLSWYPMWLSLLVAFGLGPATGFLTFFGLRNLPITASIPEPWYSGARDAARKYLQLDRSDRSEFPAGIIKTLRNPALSDKQRNELVNSMNKTLAMIEERDKSKYVLAQRGIDIDGMLDYLEDRRAGIASDIQTYKEFV